MTEFELIDRFSKAIARREGFYDRKRVPTVPQRCKNPGCLTHWKDQAGVPYPTVNGFVQFPDVEAGWRALRAQCKINILKRRLTFREFFGGKRGVYAGFCPRGESAHEYAHNVLVMVAGLDAQRYSIDTQIQALLGDDSVRHKAA